MESRTRLTRRLALATIVLALIYAPNAGAVTINEFTVPTAGSNPFDITAGPDGALWFTERTGHQIGRIPTSGSPIQEFPFDTASSGPLGITLGPDGNLWVAQNAIDKVARVSTAGAVDEFDTGAADDPHGITGGSDGRIWWASRLGFVGAINTNGTGQTTYTGFGAAGTTPREITTGLDGKIWFTDDGAGRVSRMATDGFVEEEYILPGGGTADPRTIAAGPDGAVWFPVANTNQIGRIDPSDDSMMFFNVPTAASEPDSIAAGPDGAMWFTESATRKIGRITTGSPLTITEFPLPAGTAGVRGITVGPDGALWFASEGVNKIGRLVPDPSPAGTNTVTTVPQPAARDASPPSVRMTVSGSVSLSQLLRGLLVRATPGEPAELLFELVGRPRSVNLAATGDLVLGSRRLPLAAGRRSARLRPRRRLLGKPRRSFRLTVRTTATDAAGNRTVTTKRVRVKVKRKRRRRRR